jgi:hypothetical protein
LSSDLGANTLGDLLFEVCRRLAQHVFQNMQLVNAIGIGLRGREVEARTGIGAFGRRCDVVHQLRLG